MYQFCSIILLTVYNKLIVPSYLKMYQIPLLVFLKFVQVK